MNREKRFHLIARNRNNQDEVLFEFNEEYNFYYYMGMVDKEKYKSAIILECLGYDYPVNRMSCEFPDNKPYFKERRLKNESRRKNI